MEAWGKGTDIQKYAIHVNYDLNPQQYLHWFQEQGFRCAVCLKEVLPYTFNACVDHGKYGIDGILCRPCNCCRVVLYERGLGSRGELIQSVMSGEPDLDYDADLDDYTDDEEDNEMDQDVWEHDDGLNFSAVEDEMEG
ncbi:hypothetical protein TrCOL_g2431 [Triparma columacea]|uniref:Uncharacterized protein n=1 Tax=Triparma columacea TaxID=722753 RepID=A0A9W7GMR8_9STRA|nr:hypothetical protein TrCOL_g2431 [Triparma columacea]